MSTSLLTFGDETWRMSAPGNLCFYLWHSHLDREVVNFEMAIPLVPASIEGDDWSLEDTPQAILESWGEMYLRGDLRNLEGLTLKVTRIQDDAAEDGEDNYQEEPCLRLLLQRPGQDYEQFNQEHPWFPTLKFGQKHKDEWLYSVEVRAFFPTTAYKEAFDAAAIRQHHRETGQGADLPPESEFPEPPEEGCADIDWESWTWLDRFVCYVPANSPNPIAYAKRMVKEVFKHEAIGIQYVQGSEDYYFGEFKPSDGICKSGDRCVVLCPESPRDADRREEFRKRRSGG